MNPNSLPILFFAFCTFLISIIVLLKRNDRVSKQFFVFCLFVSSWGVWFAVMIGTPIGDWALFLARLTNLSALFIAPTWLHFVYLFLGIAYKRRRIIRAVYAMSIFISCFGFSPWFVPYAKYGPNIGTSPSPALLYHIFAAEFFLVVVFGFVELVRCVRCQVGVQRVQTLALMLATFLGFFGGSLSFLPVYDIAFPKFALILMPFYPFIMAYAIMKQGLLDSEEVLAIHREKLALLGLLSSSINHEIKNPLFFLKEYTRKLSAEGGEASRSEIMAKMENQIERMSALVNRLAEFSRPDAGRVASGEPRLGRTSPSAGRSEAADKVEKSEEEVDIKSVIETALFFASQELKYRNIELKIDVQEGLPRIRGNQHQFEEIFLNLIVNAYHAMPKGGALTISVRMTNDKAQMTNQSHKSSVISHKLWGAGPVTRGPGHGNVELVVADTGIGIPPRDLKNIFKPFYTTKIGRPESRQVLPERGCSGEHSFSSADNPKEENVSSQSGCSAEHSFAPAVPAEESSSCSGEHSFSSADNLGKENISPPQGTGLGLHIVKTLVEQNKGKISVESKVGEGTRFRVQFPAVF